MSTTSPIPKTTVVNILKTPELVERYIGRPGLGLTSIFGNPYRLYKDGSREEIIIKFRKYFYNKIAKDPEFKQKVLELKDLRLGCFCAPQQCHGDVIANYLNNLPP